jgi:hypothetical protein
MTYDFYHGLFIVFNATFNNISVISRRSVLLVEETGETRENLGNDWISGGESDI